MTEHPPVARLIIRAFRHFEVELLRRLREQGISDISYANLNVIRHLDRQGLRLPALAPAFSRCAHPRPSRTLVLTDPAFNFRAVPGFGDRFASACTAPTAASAPPVSSRRWSRTTRPLGHP
ncbi:MAG TPA: hypothetical protein ENJ19_09350 [Gammaproteobacteria bacterium]|nr:hypothetical protein [Gammaproteobacteria bacterium]